MKTYPVQLDLTMIEFNTLLEGLELVSRQAITAGRAADAKALTLKIGIALNAAMLREPR